MSPTRRYAWWEFSYTAALCSKEVSSRVVYVGGGSTLFILCMSRLGRKVTGNFLVFIMTNEIAKCNTEIQHNCTFHEKMFSHTEVGMSMNFSILEVCIRKSTARLKLRVRSADKNTV